MAAIVDPAVSLLAVLLLAAIFGAAAVAKLRDLEMFAGVVEQYDLLPRALVRPFARALPVVELAGALGLLLPATRAPAAALLILLLLVFAAAMTINLARGRSEIDCGCFIGVQKQRIGWTLVVRNLALAAFGLTLLGAGTGRPLGGARLVHGRSRPPRSLLVLYEALGRLFGLAPHRREEAG